MNFIVGLLGSLCIAGAAYRLKSLSISGFISAVVMGTCMYGLGGFGWAGTLISFFLSSSLLSKYKQRRKAAIEESYHKSGRRDAGQVFANGGLGLLLCVLNAMFPNDGWLILFIGVMGTVNADTWATEIGSLSIGEPRSILTGRKVPKGTSGAVSTLGTTATVAGGLFIGIIAALLLGAELESVMGGARIIIIAGLAGWAGSLTDSLLGAKWQVMYECSRCGRQIERKQHCETPALQIRGFRWMSNDIVNASSSLVGGVTAWMVWILN